MRKDMKRTTVFLALAILFSVFVRGNTVFAQQNKFNFLRTKPKIEAEPNKEYPLTDSDGLWFIMAAKFEGAESRKTANRLVYELRKKYKLEAYSFRYDNDQDDLQKMARKAGDTRSYQYMTAPPQVYAVLIGSFPSSDDPALQQTLLTVKRSKPVSLENDPASQMTMNEFKVLAKIDKTYDTYGPLGKAMAVPNPMIPKEYFAQKGVVDSFLAKINSDSKYSLLRNPKMYTLRVATFSGKSMMNKDSSGNAKWEEAGDDFQDAGVKAAALCSALRKTGVEAWEFHDRDCSFVTIGSFDSYGNPNSDGTIEMEPEIYKLMEKYKGKIVDEKGNYEAYCANVEFGKGKTKVKMKLAFDMQPVIIMVPQLPANAQKVQAALAQRRKADEERNDARFCESMEAERQIFDMKYGGGDRDSLSAGVRVSEEDVNRIAAGASVASVVSAPKTQTAEKPVQAAPASRSVYAPAQKPAVKTALTAEPAAPQRAPAPKTKNRAPTY